MNYSQSSPATFTGWLVVITVSAVLTACGGGGGGSATPPVNRAPTANAGADKVVPENSSISLDGTGSSDSDGSIVSYAWTQVGGVAVTLANATTATPSFDSPDVTTPVDLTFELIVTDNDGAASSADRVILTVAEVPPSVTLSGKVTFDMVPRSSGGGLDYANTQQLPVAGVRVQFISAQDRSTVLASADTNDAGDYSMTVDPLTNGYVRARAEMLKPGPAGWDITVVDNNGLDVSGVTKPVYAVISSNFNTGMTNIAVTVHAASGWGGSSYSEPRAAAPFSILYAVKQAVDMVVQADPNADFPPLKLNWSPNNTVDGAVGTSFWDGQEIYLLGEEDVDTEEFDHAVIVHEWGHYFEDMFSRSDSIGGSHSFNDVLDPRVAFGEGFGNAFQGMARGSSLYFDTNGTDQRTGFSFDVESNCTSARGWFSECSVQSFLYDLFDGVNTSETPRDNVALGFGPIYDVFVADQKLTQTLTTVHSFSKYLRDLNGSAQAGIDGLLAYQDIVSGSALTEWGDNETNDGGSRTAGIDSSVLILPIYQSGLQLGVAKNVCVDVDAAEGDYNRLGNRQFIRFTVPVTGTYQITSTTTDSPPGTTPDPDMVLWNKGPTHYAFDRPNPVETFCNPASGTFDSGVCQGGALPLDAGVDYVLEVMDDNNLSYDLDAANIGLYCMDIVLTSS